MWGLPGVSQRIPGLFGGGTQDNGNLWGVSDATRPVVPLRQLDGGDGGPMRFLDNGLLVRTWNGQATVQGVPWDPATKPFDGSRDPSYRSTGAPPGS